MVAYQGQACPISGRKVGAVSSRINGWLVMFVTATALATPLHWLVWVLATDFAIKVGLGPRYSPFCWLSRFIRNLLRLPETMVDAAPKRFAAGFGFAAVTAAGLALYVVGVPPLFYAFAGLCLGCSFVEGLFGYCVGCRLYMMLPARG